MTDKDKPKERIPFESLGEETPVSSWQLPPMHIGGKVVRSASRDKGRKTPGRGAGEAIETVNNKTKPKPLTADEMQKITEEARREGFQQGLHEGTEQGILEGTKAGQKSGEQKAYNEAKKDIQALQNQLRQISTRLFDPMQQQEVKIENILVDLVLNLTKRLIADEVSTKPAVLVSLVDKVLQSIPKGAKHTRVFLNEKDAELLESLVPETQRDWLIQRDKSLSSGGCRVETESSLVDFSVEERLAGYLDKIDSLELADSKPEPLPDYHPQASQSDDHSQDIDTENEEVLTSDVEHSAEPEVQLEQHKEGVLDETSSEAGQDEAAEQRHERSPLNADDIAKVQAESIVASDDETTIAASPLDPEGKRDADTD